MDAAYTKKTAFVVLDDSEVRLIMKALDELRYSEASTTMTGSMLVNLAGLSQEWMCMSQDMGSPNQERVTNPDDGYSVVMKAIGKVLPPEYHEFWAEDVARFISVEDNHK